MFFLAQLSVRRTPISPSWIIVTALTNQCGTDDEPENGSSVIPASIPYLPFVL
jgi:hypothetical protein